MEFVEFDPKYPPLNLPSFNPRLYLEADSWWVFDPYRKKKLVLSPEEWVRQHWLHFLVEKNGYPKGLLVSEKGLKYNQLQKRTDILIRDRIGEPYLLIECKAPSVTIDERGLRQLTMYHSQLKTPYLILSNGLKHIILAYHSDSERFSQLSKLPFSPNSLNKS